VSCEIVDVTIGAGDIIILIMSIIVCSVLAMQKVAIAVLKRGFLSSLIHVVIGLREMSFFVKINLAIRNP